MYYDEREIEIFCYSRASVNSLLCKIQKTIAQLIAHHRSSFVDRSLYIVRVKDAAACILALWASLV